MSILIAGQAGVIDATMVKIADGLALTAGTVNCFVKRKSDGHWLKADGSWTADTTKPTGADIPTMTHISGGLWVLEHTSANAADRYDINCIDSGATCFPDNRSEEVVIKGTDKKALISTDAQDLSGSLDVNAKTVGDKTGYGLDAAQRVKLDAAQPDYLPAKIGDEMALTSAERTTLTDVIWNALTSGMSTVGSVGKKLADWVAATLGADNKVLISTDTQDLSGTLDVNAKAVGDKAGYALTQSFPTNFSSLSIDGSGYVTSTNAGSGASIAEIEASTVLAKEATLGTPAGASLAADIADLHADIAAQAPSGANACTITVYQHGTTTPIEDYAIDIWNSAETLYLGTITSTALGLATCNLNDGTYKLRGRLFGWLADNAVETFTVAAGSVTKTVYATAVLVSAPSAANTCRIYEYCFGADSTTPLASVTEEAKIARLPFDRDGKLHAGDIITSVYDVGTGLLYWDIVWDAQVEVTIDELFGGKSYRITIPRTATKRLKDLLR